MKIIMPQMITLMILWIIMHIMMFKKKSQNKMLSPFECGYNSFFSKLPLSIQFTLLTFIFLLFDVELSILITSNWKMVSINLNWIITMIMFFISMSISIIYEMLKKSFKWN